MKTVRLILLSIFALSVLSCHTLPDPVTAKAEYHQKPAEYGLIAETARKMQRGKLSGASAVIPIKSNKDAIDMRLALIDSAEKSLEIQLFIWMEDYTGRLLMERVLMAADRGVRVRILLDDLVLGIAYSDKELAAIQSHPNVELRLYNPNVLRDRMLARALDLMVDGGKRNQRMHNKTIIADGRLAILSGRNIGDHYFGYGGRYNLIDFGGLVSGSILPEINRGFDRYWNSQPVYDVRAFEVVDRKIPLAKFRLQARRKIAQEKLAPERRISLQRQNWQSYFDRVARTAFMSYARYYEDAPDVPSSSRPVITEIIRQCDQAKQEIVLVTPYLVPDERLMRMLRNACDRGVRVVLLVPTVASNNHLIVHNQYQKYRKVLLGMGVEIYEFKHRPAHRISPYIHEGEDLTHKVGLHAKLAIIDSRVCYFGSINFDGRALFVNTEEGLIVRSRALGQDLRSWVNLLKHPKNAWRLNLDLNGNIVWLSGKQLRTREPSLDFFQAALERLLRPLSLRHRIFPDHQVYQ